MEWVEASGSSVALAVEAALTELGLDSADQAEIEVLQQPKPGFLGIGKQDAVVKVMPKQRDKGGRRRRRKRGASSATDRGRSAGRDRAGDGARKGGARSQQTGARGGAGGRRTGETRDRASSEQGEGDRRVQDEERTEEAAMEPDTPQIEVGITEQAEVAEAFLRGLLDAFGLEGEVTSRIDDGTLYLDVSGEQTEALVGSKGAVMQAVLEVTRTVVQRKTFGAPRMRLDIAGYAERRRQALTIYTQKLADRVLAERGEVMLEPMNAADRKVVHDTVAEIEGVRSFSEGEDPERAVVIAPAE